jgi:hypothetical protein
MVNTAIEVFNKNGTVASAPESAATFFKSIFVGPNLTDPFVMYDEVAGRFVVGIMEYSSGSAANSLDLATGTDGTSGVTWSNFHKYSSGEGSLFADYPRAGWNADAYFVSWNMFNGNTFAHAQTITINKSTFAIASRHDFASSLFTVTPAIMHGAATGGPEYFVESSSGGGSSIDVVTETNVLNSPPTFTTKSISVPAYPLAPAPVQPHRKVIPSFDARIFDAAYRGGELVAAHQVGQSGSSTGFARWYEFNTSTMTLVQSGNAPPGVAGSTQFMPSVDINKAGSIGMTFDESSRREYWSMYVTERTSSDPLGTMETPVRAVAGITVSPDSRVGDFSATTVDPANGLTFWSGNEYQGSAFWNTRIASFSIAGAIASPLSTVRLVNPSAAKAQTSTPAPSQTASARGEPQTPSRVVWSRSGTQMDNPLHLSVTCTLDEFWADPANRDFLKLRL